MSPKSSPSYTIKPDTSVSWIPMSTFCLVQHLRGSSTSKWHAGVLSKNYHPQNQSTDTNYLWTPKDWKNEDFRPVEYGLLWVVTPKSEGCRFPWYSPPKKKQIQLTTSPGFRQLPAFHQSFLGRIEGLRLIGLCASLRSFMSRSSSDFPRVRDAMLHSRIHCKARFILSKSQIICLISGTGIYTENSLMLIFLI